MKTLHSKTHPGVISLECDRQILISVAAVVAYLPSISFRSRIVRYLRRSHACRVVRSSSTSWKIDRD